MNRRIIYVLAVLLGAQVLLGAALHFWPQGGGGGARPELPVADAGLDRIEIATADSTLKLVRQDGQWRLPEYFGMPASADGVKLLLDRLGKLEGGTPVATSQEARQRFKVEDGRFERRVRLYRGDTVLATVYIGTPGSRNRSHLRVEGQDAIFEEAFATYDLRVDAVGWLDKGLLKLTRDDIASIQTGGLILKANAPAPATEASAPAQPAATWQAEGLAPGQSLKPAGADRLAEQLVNLSFDGVLGSETQPDFNLSAPVLSLSVARKSGAAREYRLSKLIKEDAYALQVSDRKEVFKLLPYQAQPLIDAARPEQLHG